MTSYFLDTNVFDFFLDNNIAIENIKAKGDYYTSNVQWSEILNVKDTIRKERLIEIYTSLNQKKLLLKSGIWLDDLYWDDEQPWIDEIGETVNELTKNKKTKPWKDALIAEVAKTNNLILVSNDGEFVKKAKSFDIKIQMTADFINDIFTS